MRIAHCETISRQSGRGAKLEILEYEKEVLRRRVSAARIPKCDVTPLHVRRTADGEISAPPRLGGRPTVN